MRYGHFRANARAFLYLSNGGIAAKVHLRSILKQNKKIKLRACSCPRKTLKQDDYQ